MTTRAVYMNILKPRNSFHILLDKAYYRKGDILTYGSGNVIVYRDYRITWWKKFLRPFGLKFKCFDPFGNWLLVKPLNK